MGQRESAWPEQYDGTTTTSRCESNTAAGTDRAPASEGAGSPEQRQAWRRRSGERFRGDHPLNCFKPTPGTANRTRQGRLRSKGCAQATLRANILASLSMKPPCSPGTTENRTRNSERQPWSPEGYTFLRRRNLDQFTPTRQIAPDRISALAMAAGWRIHGVRCCEAIVLYRIGRLVTLPAPAFLILEGRTLLRRITVDH